MAEFRFNIRQRRLKTKKKDSRTSQDADQASAQAHGIGVVSSPAAALVDCIPCPALIIDDQRKISALNEPLCDAFGVKAGFFHVGEDFADFARRMSLSGSSGLLALGDFLANDKPPRSAKIIAQNGDVYEARACQTADEKTLITLAEPTPNDSGDLIKYSHNIVKNMPGVVLSVAKRPDGSVQCLYANTMSLELLGLGLREITGPEFDFLMVIAEPHRAEFERSLELSTAKLEPFDAEFKVDVAPSGQRWVRCLAACSHGTDGAVIFYLRMLDIEDRRRIAEERQRLQTLLDLVVDNIPLMVNVKNAQDLSFVLVNQAFEDMTGLERHDVIGQKDVRPFSEWAWENRKTQFDRVLDSEHPVDFPESIVETPNKEKGF